MSSRSTLLAALAALAAAAAAASGQLPPATRYVASTFGLTAGNALAGFAPSGTVTTVVPLAASSPSQAAALAMGPTNDAVLVWDATGVHRYELRTGHLGFSSLAAAGGDVISWGCLDEDGGMLWCTDGSSGTGRLYRSADPTGTATTVLLALPFQSLNAVCWVGSTGGYALAQFHALGGNLYFLARDGTPVRAVAGLPSLSGLDWNPWDDRVYASRFGGGHGPGLVQVDPHTGRATSLGPAGPVSATNNAVEALDQPVNRLVCAEYGFNPQHLWTLDPVTRAATTLHASSGRFGFSDAAAVRSRPLWATGPWTVGRPGRLSLHFGPACAGLPYLAALSLASGPGIPAGAAGRVHLAPDNLLFGSLQIGAPIFNHFAGVLNLQGRASPAPFVGLPNVKALRGVRVYAGAVAYDRSGVRAVSNAWGTTIR